MEENVDVKALMARFRQTGMMATGGGGGSPRLPPPILERGVHSPVDPGANGSVRPRFSVPLNKPNPGPISPSNGPRFGQAPRGVFPRPPPSHRPNHQEPVRTPIAEADKPGSFRNSTEKLVRPMPKPHGFPGGRGPQTIHTPPLLSQRSMSTEVPPLLRPLPTVGSRPKKPKRPPFVNLEQFRRNSGTPKPTARLSGRTLGDSNSPTTSGAAGVKMPPLLPNRPKNMTVPVPKQDMDDDQDTYDDIEAFPPPPPPPSTQTEEGFSPSSSRPAGISSPPFMPSKPSSMTHSLSVQDLDDDQDTYDDIEALPPPPPPPPTSQDSWNDQHSSRAEEWDDSDESEIYEEVDSQDSIPLPTDTGKHSKKDMKRQKEQEKKEQREREKKEIAYRKKFKLTGNETALHIARVREDWQGGKNDLSVQQGESVEIIRTENNPEGRWLARTIDGRYGYISTKCVDMDYEEVKRRFGSLARPRPDPGVYDDVNSMEGYGCEDFPPPPVEISPDPKMLKKMESKEKEFRKKFKFEGSIQVLRCMRVDPNANIKKAGGKDLNVVRGDLLDVIQFIGDKKALCRNGQGKYGYVPMAYLLPEEGEIYDDIDYPGDVYDNDSNM
ncbi:FYN-binding protein 1 isoform X1 [Alosa sapidissima]|uniref:FYN-binding protein 1 isoform X1 n=1 Tax=Alosa sapidissima TaxID=34773 RepID=UPI001C0863A9|nr:FYN-binding protein 1 isoform X1 [Alosa sapidissima]